MKQKNQRQIYHLMGHSCRSEIQADIYEVWQRFRKLFLYLRDDRGHCLRSFVLMNNHFHSLVEVYDEVDLRIDFLYSNVSSYTGFSSKELQLVSIDNHRQYCETYKYIYRNPIESGLSKKAEDYLYSTLTLLLKGRDANFPVVDNMNVLQNPTQVLAWLNQPDYDLYWKAHSS